MDGDVRLGALFPIHQQGHPCGEIQKEDGIQPLEAMLFTIDEINRDPKLLPGIKLGVRAFDSCDNPLPAADKALSLIKGFIARKSNLSCAEEPGEQWKCGDNVVGIVGPQTSPVSTQIANLGRLFRVPQVSYLSTTAALCNREEFPYFFRTVPSDTHQAMAIVELLKTFDWTYASIVHSDSDYGNLGYQALKKLTGQEKGTNVCLADPITIYNAHFTDKDYDEVIEKLLENKLSSLVIVFADRGPAGKLLEAAKRMKVKDKFVWVGSDAWASRESVVETRESIVEGAIAIQPLRQELPGYNEYFSERVLNSDNNRNPWFDEYLRRYHNCSNDSRTYSYLPRCDVDPNHFKYSQQLYIHFVRDAVYAFAHALHNLHQDACGWDGERLCPQFKRRVFYDLKDYLRDVSFQDVDGKEFVFYGDGDGTVHDGPARYSIINFQRSREGRYDWKNVGTFHDGQFTEWDSSFRLAFSSDKSITHCMRKKCRQSEIKVQNTEDLCCWHCTECEELQFKHSDYECQSCPLGARSDGPNRTGCELIPETYLDYTNPWAISSMVFAAIGILVTVVTTCVLWIYWRTPVVKACGRELSIMLLIGTFLSFLTTFAIVAKPTENTCGVMRFGIGFCYTVCYAAVVTKTNRVSRIFFNVNHHPRFTSPLWAIVIACGLVSVEVVINVIWLFFEPPSVTYIVTQPGRRILTCSGVNDSFIAGLIYPFFLIFCATIYAFKTRKSPDGFNETRYIFFASTITCIHWLAYVPLYLASTDPEIRPVILAFSLCISGLVQLCCLLLPKLYTVIFKPEKNTKVVVMTKKHRSWPNTSNYGLPDTPPNSLAMESIGATGGGAVVGPGSAAASNAVVLLNTRRSVSFVDDKDRQPSCDELAYMSYRSLSAEAATASDERPARARSSSVCRGTQTCCGDSGSSIDGEVKATFAITDSSTPEVCNDDAEDNPFALPNLYLERRKTDDDDGIHQDGL